MTATNDAPNHESIAWEIVHEVLTLVDAVDGDEAARKLLNFDPAKVAYELRKRYLYIEVGEMMHDITEPAGLFEYAVYLRTGEPSVWISGYLNSNGIPESLAVKYTDYSMDSPEVLRPVGYYKEGLTSFVSQVIRPLWGQYRRTSR